MLKVGLSWSLTHSTCSLLLTQKLKKEFHVEAFFGSLRWVWSPESLSASLQRWRYCGSGNLEISELLQQAGPVDGHPFTLLQAVEVTRSGHIPMSNIT